MTEPTPQEEPIADVQRRAAQLAVAASALYAEAAHLKEQLSARMNVGDSARPLLDNGTDHPPVLATISYKHGSSGMYVWDEAAFTAWVDEQYPGEIEMIERIRPAFMKRFVVSNGVLVGPGGEIDIPGVGVTTGHPTVSITPNKDVKAELMQQIRGQRVAELLGPDHD